MGRAEHSNGLIDPVCGMSVAADAGKPVFDYKGQQYHFCCDRCQERFAEDPWFFLNDGPARSGAQQSDALFTCPMDPEVVQEGAGTCGVCGMALEPMSGVSDEPNHELIDFNKRMIGSLLLAAPLSVIAMSRMLGLSFLSGINDTFLRWFEFALATPVVLWFGLPLLKRGWTSIRSGNFNMWTLIAIGVSAAFGYSVVATLLPGLFPQHLLESLAGSRQSTHVPVFFEAAAVIVALVFVGQVMELKAREKTGDAIRALVDLAPKTARRVLPDGEEYDAPLQNILPDDMLRVRPGDSIAVDGIITGGSSSIDESLLTGEPLPVVAQAGHKVSAGTVNTDGTFVMRAQAVGENTALGSIVAMVASAQRSRSPMQNLADKVAGWFVPGVVAIALLAFLIWWFVGPDPSLVYALTAAVSVLIIACPCALGLATPMSVMIASGRGAMHGILVRDASALDKLSQIDTMVLDKTGTLTAGVPVVSDVVALQHSTSEAEIVAVAAAVERGSEHPLAKAVLELEAAQSESVANSNYVVTEFSNLAGKGIQAKLDGDTVLLGNRALMQQADIETASLESRIEALEKQSKTVMILARAGVAIGFIAVTDPVKDGADKAIADLLEYGIDVHLASGDNIHTAQRVADELGIKHAHGAMLPQDKLVLLKNLQQQGHVVAMVGDGINDSPALAQADVGMAMGSGADVALEAAGITLLHSNPDALVSAHRLAIATRRNIKQNLLFAFAYNLIGIPLAAGVFYPLFGWLLSPMFAAAAMACSSVLVITNALRLRSLRL